MPAAYGAEFRQDVIDVACKREAPLAQIAKVLMMHGSDCLPVSRSLTGLGESNLLRLGNPFPALLKHFAARRQNETFRRSEFLATLPTGRHPTTASRSITFSRHRIENTYEHNCLDNGSQ